MSNVSWLIDIGNSRIKWASIENGCYKTGGALIYKGLAVDVIISKMEMQSGKPIKVYIASVANFKLCQQIELCLRESFNLESVLFKTTKRSLGVTNGYTDASQLGIDRWLAIIEAYNLTHCDVMVVDVGSALTIDFIDATGQHYGGLITAGLSMMRNSLSINTALLDYTLLQDDCFAYNSFKTNTQEAIRAGTFLALINLITTEASKFEKLNNGKTYFYITGGDAEVLLPFLGADWIHKADLVLSGMHRLVSSTE